MSHPFTDRYLPAWERTLAAGLISEESVAQSRFYFDEIIAGLQPTPKRFATFAIVVALPMPIEVQQIFTQAWNRCMDLLGHPLAYGVEPDKRHIEVFLFSRPEEQFPRDVVDQGIAATLPIADNHRPFNVELRHPFMTPDGTIVCPGYPAPHDAVDRLRDDLRAASSTFPQKQSRWFHTSLGRVLEPLDNTRLAPLLDDMRMHWDKPLATLTIDRLLWTHEKQWYMVDKDILYTHPLR